MMRASGSAHGFAGASELCGSCQRPAAHLRARRIAGERPSDWSRSRTIAGSMVVTVRSVGAGLMEVRHGGSL